MIDIWNFIVTCAIGFHLLTLHYITFFFVDLDLYFSVKQEMGSHDGDRIFIWFIEMDFVI